MQAITNDYRLTSIKSTPELLKGVDAAIYKYVGRSRRSPRIVERLLREARVIHGQSDQWKTKSDRVLRTALSGYRDIFRRGRKDHRDHLPAALSAICECADRKLGMRPYPVQIVGALALYEGYVAEMATGEGKTLTAALTGVLRGWSGRPCHIITANDYLAQRDAEELTPLYRFCSVSVGCVSSNMQPEQRRQGYRNDVTYSTAKEVTADFLRDRLALGKLQDFSRRQIRQYFDETSFNENGVVTRGLHTAIVDEADSLLIDEAVTPLIISRKQPNEEFTTACNAASRIAENMVRGTHYTADHQYREIEFLPSLDFNELRPDHDIPRRFTGEGFQRELIRQALTAREFFHRDKQYVVQDDKIVIVDEFTGRTMEQRSWSEGLHQMVEAKEKLPITPPNETLARLSFQRYFRFYQNLSGMTGTAREASDELWHMYGLPVIPIPSNRPCRRIILPRRFFKDQNEKWEAIIDEIARMHDTGRPVLVGTRTVGQSEEIAQRARERGYSCRIINAVRHRDEAQIVAQAGKRGAVTIATNMAGRGTDIKIAREVEALGGLHVINAEVNESARIDRQLFGRCSRQGDRGSARSFVSIDDEVLRRFVGPLMLRAARQAVKAGRPNALRICESTVRRAQQKAQQRAYQSRRAVQNTDTWLKDSLTFTHGGF